MVKSEKQQVINWKLLAEGLGRVARILKWPMALLLFGLIIGVAVRESSSTLHINSTLILEYISALKWPVIVLVIILILRPHLPELISRIREFGLGSARAAFDPAQQSQKITSASKLKEVDQEVDEPAVLEEDSSGSEDLQSLLTSPQAIAAYEQTYRVIFGTQLEVLKRLLSYMNGLGVNGLQDIYNEHRLRAISANSYPYPNLISFMQFLLDNVLVVHEPDTDLYKLTNAGFYFLKYLMEQGLLSQEKPY